MKKVLFTATVDSHILQFHIPFLKLFKENGYEVHVATNGDKEIPYCDKKIKINFERSPFKLNNLKAISQLRKVVNEENYEIIHTHTPMGSVVTRLASKKARKKGTRVIYTAHGFHFFKGASIVNWLIYYPIEKICSRWTDCLITITEEDYELAKKKFKKVKQIEHVYGVGINTERLEKELSEEEKRNVRKELGINEDDIVFSYVAELNKNKNQILLINTIKELKKEKANIKLLLIGEGGLHQYYEDYIQQNQLQDNVFLLGRRNDINELLSITDIYLASSIREGLPVNVMEAMYKGLPIIATDNRGHKELVEDGKNGYIRSNEYDMIEGINKMMKDKKMCNTFSKNGKIKSDRYILSNIKECMCNIYYNKI